MAAISYYSTRFPQRTNLQLHIVATISFQCGMLTLAKLNSCIIKSTIPSPICRSARSDYVSQENWSGMKFYNQCLSSELSDTTCYILLADVTNPECQTMSIKFSVAINVNTLAPCDEMRYLFQFYAAFDSMTQFYSAVCSK